MTYDDLMFLFKKYKRQNKSIVIISALIIAILIAGAVFAIIKLRSRYCCGYIDFDDEDGEYEYDYDDDFSDECEE